MNHCSAGLVCVCVCVCVCVRVCVCVCVAALREGSIFLLDTCDRYWFLWGEFRTYSSTTPYQTHTHTHTRTHAASKAHILAHTHTHTHTPSEAHILTHTHRHNSWHRTVGHNNFLFNNSKGILSWKSRFPFELLIWEHRLFFREFLKKGFNIIISGEMEARLV